jgi:hypothetical protein
MAVKTYDPKEISIIVGTAFLSGFADGSFVTVRRNADTFALQVGADGKGVRTKSNDRSGQIEIVLQSGADSNSFLSDLAISDEATNGGLVPLTIKDNLGTKLHFAEQAWIKKQPDDALAKENGDITWLFETDDLSMYIGNLKNS